MVNENDIRAKLLNLNDLDEFEDWLVQNSWNMHHDSSQAAQKLVGEIELLLLSYLGLVRR